MQKDDESVAMAVGQVLGLVIFILGTIALGVVLTGYAWRLGQWASGWLY